MLGKRIINTGGVSCTTDTTQILDAGTTESIALYRFEDNAFDTSDSTGYINKGAVFNGSSSKINLAAGSFTYTGEFSITAWIKLKSNQANQTILENYDYLSSTSRGFNFRVHTGDKLKFDGYYSDYTRTDALSSTSIPLNTWTHVAAVYNPTNSSIKLYINGSEVSYTTQTYNAMQYHSNCAVNIGALTYGTGGGAGANDQQWFNGHIDELRVYDDALTATEIGYIANNTTASIPTGNLVALYSFEGNANDSTSSPINGTASNVRYDYNGTASNVTYTTGKFGKAAVFNGSNSKIDVGQIPHIVGDVSVSVWLKTTSTASGGSGIIELNNDSSSNGWAGSLQVIYTASTGSVLVRVGNASNAETNVLTHTVSNLNNGSWHNLVVTRNDTSNVTTLYIDGSQADQETVSATSTAGAATRIGGRHYSAGANFNGTLDQLRIFDKSLSSGEVNSLYNETATSAASATINNPSTLAYYKMADATDETGSYNGTPTNVDFNVQGKYGFAGKFNGSSSQIVLPNSLDSVLGNNNFSYSFWIKGPMTSTNQIWFSLAQNYFVYIGYFSGAIYISLYNNTFSTGVSISADTWAHIVFVKSSSSGITIYKNGTSAYTSTTAAAKANLGTSGNGQINVIGKYSGGGYQFDGNLDQIRLFNKAISAAEATTLYNEIQCANTIATPESYFNTVLYTGDGNSSKSVTGVGFQPDWTWIKNRSSSGENHNAWDSVRGNGYTLYPNLSNAQNTGNLLTLNTDGFTLNTINNNINTHNYVSWNWKAASSNTTNNDGTITSTVRASQESGFSIATYTGNGSAGATVGHGLNKIPSMVITKGISGSAGATNWNVYTSITGATKKLVLNTNATEATNTTYWNDTAPTASVFSLGTTGDSNYNGSNYVAYCFANVDGYQRIGSYTGNNSTAGPFVYTGFEPAWLLIKRIDGGNSSWAIHDNKRATSNPRNKELFANLSDAESTFTAIDFFTNGFQVITSNALYNNNNNNYLFLAIAANPDTTEPTKANSFKTVLYTGNGGTQSITGAGFKPDLAWIKRRSSSEDHVWFDTIRGPQRQIRSNATASESTKTNALSSFDSDGFTTGANNALNTNNETYVSWLWKALDHDRNLPAINNNGQISALVSANPDAGFSILQWVSDGSASISTKGHGLNAAPEMFIVYSRTHGSIWQVYHKDLALNRYIYLNGSDALSNAGATYYSSSANTIGFRDGSNSGSGQNMIAYCWHSVSGYSKIGSYTISSSSDRVITGLGFSPSWVMVKRTDSSGSWVMTDASRLITKELYADLNNQENTDSNGVQSFDSDGFTVGTGSWLGASGGTYIYMAFK